LKICCHVRSSDSGTEP